MLGSSPFTEISDVMVARFSGSTLRLVPPASVPALAAGVIERGATIDSHSRSCSHWPMNGLDDIQAAGAALQHLVQLWDQAEQLFTVSGRAQSGSRVPEGVVVDEIEIDLLLLKAAEAPHAAQVISQQLVDLAQQFSAVNKWLLQSARVSCEGVQKAPRHEQALAVLRDDHRVIARDWLGADMNAGISRLLLRAAQILHSVDLSPRAIHDDLLGSRDLRVPLQAAATILERAGALAADCAAFVRNFDQQWLSLRGEISATMALHPHGNVSGRA